MAKGNQKKNKRNTPPPTAGKQVKSTIIANVVGCQDSTVRQVRCGALNNGSELTETIIAVDQFLEDGFNKLLESARKLVPFN